MNAMFSDLGVLHVDHYAVTTNNLTATLNDYLSIPGSRLIRGPGENPAQGVEYAFVELNGMGMVEILTPLDENSPILRHLGAGGGAYHLCFTVRNLDNALAVAKQQYNAKVIVRPRADGAFDSRRVAFVVDQHHGLFELLEAYPAPRVSTCVKELQSKPHHNTHFEQLKAVFSEIITTLSDKDDNVVMSECPEWDSFKHLMLIMELEKEFDISVPADEIANLDSLTKLSEYIDNKL